MAAAAPVDSLLCHRILVLVVARSPAGKSVGGTTADTRPDSRGPKDSASPAKSVVAEVGRKKAAAAENLSPLGGRKVGNAVVLEAVGRSLSPAIRKVS